METYKTVKVWVVGVEVARFMHSVIVLHKRAYLHRVGNTIFHDGAKWIEGCALRQWKLLLAICHALWADEVYRKLHTMEKVCQLHPSVSRERGFGAGTEDKETDRWRRKARVFPRISSAGSRWMEGVSKRWVNVS